jgi:hypothetical protein
MALREFRFFIAEGAPGRKKNGLSIINLDTFLKSSTLQEMWNPLGATTHPFPHDELQGYLGRIKDKTKGKLEKYAKPYIHGSNIEIVGEHGQEYDLEKLRASVTERPKRITKQNEKMQHSDGTSSIFFNVGLPALKGLAVDEKTGEFVIVDTCPGAGVCKTFCYAMKGGYIQYPASSLGTTRVLNFLLNDPDGFKHMLSSELAEAERKYTKKGTKVVLRWHDAGDFFSPEYMEVAFDVARRFPNINFYAYTKIAAVAQASSKPANFLFNFSGGAQPSQEKMVDFAKTKHSRVVPKEMFYDLIARHGNTLIKDTQGRMQFKSHEALVEFKHRLASKYAIADISTVITYDEMMHKPVGTTPHWNVLVWPGHGDDSATRKDVLGTYLLIH